MYLDFCCRDQCKYSQITKEKRKRKEKREKKDQKKKKKKKKKKKRKKKKQKKKKKKFHQGGTENWLNSYFGIQSSEEFKQMDRGTIYLTGIYWV